VCCDTHPLRDALDYGVAKAAGPEDVAFLDSLAAPGENFRCRCSETAQPCRRKATGEDLVCDWCRQTDHLQWHAERMRDAMAAQEGRWGPRGPAGFSYTGYGLEGNSEWGAMGAELCDPPAGGAIRQGLAYSAGSGIEQFRIQPGAFEAGLQGMRVSAHGSLTPAEIRSLLGRTDL
jgi:hypothetical protein